jgi:hypothetical protein
MQLLYGQEKMMAKIDPVEVSLIYELIGLIHESWVDLEKAEEYIKKEFI